jgi:hypothetical protein
MSRVIVGNSRAFVSMEDLINSVDAIKDKITSAEYRDICDRMKIVFDQQRETVNYYRVWYFTVDTATYAGSDGIRTMYKLKINNKIIRTTHEEYIQIKLKCDNIRSKAVLVDIHEGQSDLPVVTNNQMQYLHPENEEYNMNHVFRIEPDS